MKIKLFLLILVLLVIIFSSKIKNGRIDYSNISLPSDIIVVDVRSEREYNEGHIANAINIPFKDFKKRMHKQTS